jgi:hypothetical protein
MIELIIPPGSPAAIAWRGEPTFINQEIEQYLTDVHAIRKTCTERSERPYKGIMIPHVRRYCKLIFRNEEDAVMFKLTYL